MTCEINLNQGRARGKKCVTFEGKSYYSFEGLPYAKPPVGNLRFRPPQEPVPWSGVWDATKPGNKCVQIDPYSQKPLEGSEDCLYLNVYTPVLPHEEIKKLPVAFFVHGGRFLFGYGDYYRPDLFIRHDVILVTINYRLSVFGFICLDLPEAPGNSGLKDTVMALKWVKNNISFFNGDSNNVTAMGESAGAGGIAYYLTSKMANGLCHKIIAQSGVSTSHLLMDKEPVEKARNIASILGKDLTDSRDIYEFLIKVPAEELIYAAIAAEVNRPPAVINAYLLTVIEKEFEGIERFIESDPFEDISKGSFNKLPIIVGLNSFEGAVFLRKDDNNEPIFEEDLQFFIPRLLSIKHDTPQALKFASKIKNYYFGNGRNLVNYLNCVSDAYMNRDILMFTEMVSKYSKNVFLYRFDYDGSINTSFMKKLKIKGATHGDMIQYLFYVKKKFDKGTENDLKMADFICESWCNFIKNGEPTWTNQETKWLPYSLEYKQCLNIDESIQLIPFPHWNRIQFWIDIMKNLQSKL